MSNPSSDSYRNPLRHMGQDYSFAPRYLRNRDPRSPTNASLDIKPKENQGYYPFGTIWNNSSNGNVWILAGITNNLANWVLFGNNHGNLLTLSDNQNVVVNPNLSTGNIQLTGQLNENGTSVPSTFQTIVSNPVNNSINFNPMSPARWVVDPLSTSPFGVNGTHSTISSAIASASSGDTILLLSGAVYTENINLDLFAVGVGGTPTLNICGLPGDSNNTVVVSGKWTCTSSKLVTISNVDFLTNADFFLSITGGAPTQINIDNSFLNCVNNTGINFASSNANAELQITKCRGNVATTGITPFVSSSAGTLALVDVYINNSGGSTTPSTCSAGVLNIQNTILTTAVTFSGTSAGTWEHTDINMGTLNIPCLILGGSGIQSFIYCRFLTGTASAVSISTAAIFDYCEIGSSNTNAITGTGSIFIGFITFVSSSSKINGTLTLAFLNTAIGNVVYGTISATGVLGSTTGAAPAAGFIGEQIISSVLQGAPISLSTATAATITSIVLTEGVWDISAIGGFTGTPTGLTQVVVNISTTDNTLVGNEGQSLVTSPNAPNVDSQVDLSIPAFRVLLAAGATYYLVLRATFTGSTCAGFGRISAVRVG